MWTLRARFWLEASAAALGGFMLLLTLLWRDWIEAILHVDPDAHSGRLEWLVSAGLLAVCATFTNLACAERGRQRAPQQLAPTEAGR